MDIMEWEEEDDEEPWSMCDSCRGMNSILMTGLGDGV